MLKVMVVSAMAGAAMTIAAAQMAAPIGVLIRM
jgi:hypothetical protein